MSVSLAEFQARVEEKATSLHPGRAVLTVVAALLYAVGWLIGLLFKAAWAVIAWGWAAAVVGFTSARSHDGVGS